MASAAELRFLVSVQDRDLKRLQAEIRQTNKALGQDLPAATGKGSAGLGRFAGAAKVAGVALLAGLALGARAGFKELAEGQKVAAQTGAVLKSTGGAAGVTAKEIEGLAESISDMSGVDDEAIQAGQNLLLTFTKIRDEAGAGNDVFSQATRIMTDMSVAMGTDVTSGAIQLGKALNDPIAGVSALSEVGVSFTAAQKDQIKAMVGAGDVMGAQKLILAELNTEFGGSAKAAGETLPGQLAKGSESFNEMAASIMQALVPALGAGASGLGKVADFMSRHTTLAKVAVGAIAGLGLGLIALNTALKAHAFFTLVATEANKKFVISLLTNPIFLWAAGLTALAVALVVAYKKSETFRAVVDGAFGALRGTVLGFVTFFTKDLPAAFQKVLDWTRAHWPEIATILAGPFAPLVALATGAFGIRAALTGALSALKGAVGGLASGIGSAIRTGIVSPLASLGGELSNMVLNAIAGVALFAFSMASSLGTAIVNGIKSGVGGLMGDLKSWMEGQLRSWLEDLNPFSSVEEGGAKHIGRPVVRGAARAIKEGKKPLALALTDAVRGAIREAKANVESLAGGLAGMITEAIGARAGAATAAVDASPEAVALRALEAAKEARATAAERTRLMGAIGEAAAGGDMKALAEAHVALAEWEADQAIAAAQKALDARKATIAEGAEAAKTATDQGLADLASAFARGEIKQATFLERLKTIIGDSGADFASIGSLLGSAFVTGFNEELAALQEQVREVVQGPQGKGGLGPGVVSPFGVQAGGWEARRRELANALASARNAAKLLTGPGKATVTKDEQRVIDTAAKALADWMLRKPKRSYQHGIDYVPSTGPALLHRGERVVPAERNRPGASITVHIAQMIVREAADVDRVAEAWSRKLAVAGVRV